MSARGSFVTNPGARSSKLLTEATNRIPLFWLSFLSTEDIDRAEHAGQFRMDRVRSIERASNSLPFFLELFPDVNVFEGTAGNLLKLVRSKRAKTIGIEIIELLEELQDSEGNEGMPKLRTAVEAIERRDAGYSLTIPARTIKNPFTHEDMHLKERRFGSTREMLLSICSHRTEDLQSRKKEEVQDAIVGRIWEWE